MFSKMHFFTTYHWHHYHSNHFVLYAVMTSECSAGAEMFLISIVT